MKRLLILTLAALAFAVPAQANWVDAGQTYRDIPVGEGPFGPPGDTCQAPPGWYWTDITVHVPHDPWFHTGH